MSRCIRECQEVEASIEKLQLLLAMESHLDEELDELERLYQLDQLKYEWLMREGHPDLCDIIKEQMQKTESLLRMYSPMLQDTCAEKEAHITHILTMQRQRRFSASGKQHHQHHQIMQPENYLQEHTHGMLPVERCLTQNDLLQWHPVCNRIEMQNRHLKYFSTNTRSIIEHPEITERAEEKLSSQIVEGQEIYEIYENVLGFQKQVYKGMKRKFPDKIIPKSKGWWRKKLLRCKFSDIEKQCNSSNISILYLKSKAVSKRPLCALGQFRQRHSFSKGIQRKKYLVRTKNIIKLRPRYVRKEKIHERNPSGGLFPVSANTTQLMEASCCNQKISNTKRITNSKGKNLVRCTYATQTRLRNNFKSLSGNLFSSLKPHQKQTLPSQDHTRFLSTMPTNSLHINKHYFKFNKPLLRSHDQRTLSTKETNNSNRESRNNSPSLNDTTSGLLDKAEMQIVSVNTDIAGVEQNSFNVNDYASPLSNGFDLLERDYVRE